MDTITDFFEELKRRLNNPLIGSFILSSLICNSQIPIALLFYSQDDLKRDGYTSFFHLIYSINIWQGFVIPFVFGFFYTFVFPYIKAFIKGISFEDRNRERG
jgi:hypothetical protein